MQYSEVANQLASSIDKMGMQQRVSKQELQAKIVSQNIVYTNSYIKNLTAFKGPGDSFEIHIPSMDSVLSLGEVSLGFRLRIYDTGAETQVNPTMFNLPDVTTLMQPTSFTLNGTELLRPGIKSQQHRNILKSVMDRVRPKAVAENNYTLNMYQKTDIFPLNQSIDGSLVNLQSNALCGMKQFEATDDSTANLKLAVDKIRNYVQPQIGGYQVLFQENAQSTYLPNMSIQSILKDSSRRLKQAQKHYSLVTPAIVNTAQAGLGTGKVQFKQISGNTDNPSKQDQEYSNWYEVKLGQILNETTAFENFYMLGNSFRIVLRLNSPLDCMTKIAKPYSQNTFLTQDVAVSTLSNDVDKDSKAAGDVDENSAVIQQYSKVKYQFTDTYIAMPHCNILPEDKQVFKQYQSMGGIPLKRYEVVQNAIVQSGAQTHQQQLDTKNLTGIMVCFTSAQNQKGGLFKNITGDDAGANKLIQQTDFTHDDIATDGNRMSQKDYDHYYLPIAEVRCVIGNTQWKVQGGPPVGDYNLAQYIGSIQGAQMLLGKGLCYDVSLTEFLANRAVYFIPIGKDHSGVNTSNSENIQVQVIFQQDQTKSEQSDTKAGLNCYNRNVLKYNMNVIYCMQDYVMIDNGFVTTE